MSVDPRFEIEPGEYTDRQQRRSKWTSCLIGCLVVLGVLMVFAIILAVWIGRNWREWTSDFASQAVNQTVDQSDLPAQEKVEVKEELARVVEAFRRKQITMEQVGRIMEKVMQSPLMPMMAVAVVDKQYLDKSGLSDDEKTEGRLALKRFARGAVDKKIPQAGIDAVMTHVADRGGNGEWQLRQQVSDADLRAALAEAKAQADTANIPEQPEDFDVSDEFKKIIDDALNPNAAADIPAEAPAKAEQPPAEPAEKEVK
jgi:hypothetical protein